MATIVRMPEVLANVTEAAIQSWLVRAGQPVSVGSPLAEVETEKAVVEYAAETEGTVLKLLVSEGQAVQVGDPIALIGSADEAVEDAPDAPDGGAGLPAADAPAEARVAPEPETAPDAGPSPVADAPTELPGEHAGDAEPGERRFVSPIVRRLARERGIDLMRVPGTGPGGRIVRRDLDRLPPERLAAPVAAAAPVSEAPAASTQAPRTDRATAQEAAAVIDVPLTGMRRAIARRLTESKTTVPHFYMAADCRVDALLDLRRRVNQVPDTKVSLNDFVIKAVAGALGDVPEANAIWGEGAIRRFSGVDIAVAVAVDAGLLTPVVRGVDQLPLRAVSGTIADLVARAKSGRLRQHELEGGSFSVSNLGMYGVQEFSAIINPPQSAILAVGAAGQRAVVVDGALAVATVMTVTLSADHRVLDGALAARWLAAFVARIEDPLRILL